MSLNAGVCRDEKLWRRPTHGIPNHDRYQTTSRQVTGRGPSPFLRSVRLELVVRLPPIQISSGVVSLMEYLTFKICFTTLCFVDVAADHVEGGMYISPEFQVGQVYDGSYVTPEGGSDDIILYRPVYVNADPQKAVSLAKQRHSHTLGSPSTSDHMPSTSRASTSRQV